MYDFINSWYAVKVYTERQQIMKYFRTNGIETFIPMLDSKPLLGPIMFLHCNEDTVIRAKSDWYHQMMVYRNPGHEYPQSIPDAEMVNFRMVLKVKGQEIYPLEINDRKFLEGQKVMVLDGPLKGAVGVIKRVKGDRRLVVSVSGIAAVATSYVKPELLESVE